MSSATDPRAPERPATDDATAGRRASTRAHARRRSPRGFTLLEVMCAFAILTIIVMSLVRSYVETMGKAATALSMRELHEAADTIFRKMIYQWQLYNDGDAKTLDVEYGDFARLPRIERERWARYRYVLHKKVKNVAGAKSADSDWENLFEDKDKRPAWATPEPTPDGEAAPESVALIHLALEIHDVEEGHPEGKPLLTLSTWIDPHDHDLTKSGR